MPAHCGMFSSRRVAQNNCFLYLPILMECRPFAPSDDEENVTSFFVRWNSAMTALTNAYDGLLQRIEDAISAAFGTGDWTELQVRSAVIGAHLSEPALVAFVQRDVGEVAFFLAQAIAAGY